MSRQGVLGPIALVGAVLIAAAAYAAQPSGSEPESGGRTMPMDPGTMMGPGMMGQSSMMGMMAPDRQMQQMMAQCQRMMQSWMRDFEGQDRPQEKSLPDNPG